MYCIGTGYRSVMRGRGCARAQSVRDTILILFVNKRCRGNPGSRMRFFLISALIFPALISASPTLIFPAPQRVVATGPPLHVDASLNITTTHESDRLARTIERYVATIRHQTQLGCLKCCDEPLPDGTCCCLVEGCPKELPPSCPSPPATTITPPTLRQVIITITGAESEELYPSRRTCYNYSLTIRSSPPTAEIVSCSVFGAAYALEGFTQLLAKGGGARLPHDAIYVRDAPAYSWRGLMIDTGRRFFPMPLVKNLLDTMAAVKLNVLHLHASDFCRFAVESKVFPNLTASLTGIHAGHYTQVRVGARGQPLMAHRPPRSRFGALATARRLTWARRFLLIASDCHCSQADVGEMISYASDRGIRVVPEFDVPGHSRGLLPLEAEGVQFCTAGEHRSQLYNDPAGKTYAAVHRLLAEMATVFKDEVRTLDCR